MSVRADAAPGPHGPVPVRVYNDGAGDGSRDLVSAANPIDTAARIVGRQVGLIPGV